jgi:hypothetical protein
MSEPTCINLAQMFSDRYRIGHDEAAITWGERRDPWMMTIPCAGRGLTIYPQGGTTLALECNCRPGIARQVAATPGVRIHQDGGMAGGMTFLFDVSLFEQVAEIVKPRRRRRLSEEERARRIERFGAARRNAPEKVTSGRSIRG